MAGLVKATTGAAAIDVVALSYTPAAGSGAKGRPATVRVNAACALVVRLAGQPADTKSSVEFFAAGDTLDQVAMVWGTGDGTTGAIGLDLGWAS